jgi:hypothetical protein
VQAAEAASSSSASSAGQLRAPGTAVMATSSALSDTSASAATTSESSHDGFAFAASKAKSKRKLTNDDESPEKKLKIDAQLQATPPSSSASSSSASAANAVPQAVALLAAANNDDNDVKSSLFTMERTCNEALTKYIETIGQAHKDNVEPQVRMLQDLNRKNETLQAQLKQVQKEFNTYKADADKTKLKIGNRELTQDDLVQLLAAKRQLDFFNRYVPKEDAERAFAQVRLGRLRELFLKHCSDAKEHVNSKEKSVSLCVRVCTGQTFAISAFFSDSMATVYKKIYDREHGSNYTQIPARINALQSEGKLLSVWRTVRDGLMQASVIQVLAQEYPLDEFVLFDV